MPARSKAQARMMNAAEHNPKFAKKVGISKKVATEFAASGAAYRALPARKRKKK